VTRDQRIMWGGGFVGASAVALMQGHFMAALVCGLFGVGLRLSAEAIK
jgi:hypothetical protein